MLGWVGAYRRAGVEGEQRAEILRGLLHLAYSLICLRYLPAAQVA